MGRWLLDGSSRRRQLWLRLNRAGRVLQAAGPESDVEEDEAERVHSVIESTTQQSVSPKSYVLGDRLARATQRQQRSWRQTHTGVVEVQTVAPQPCEGWWCRWWTSWV